MAAIREIRANRLRGYKIAGPTVLARIPEKELSSLMAGYGYRPYFVEGDEPDSVHRVLAGTLDTCMIFKATDRMTEP